MVTDNRWGTREVEITARAPPRRRTATSTPRSPPAAGLTVAVDYTIHADVKEFVFGLAFKRSDGINISGPNTKTARLEMQGRPRRDARHRHATPSRTSALLGAKYLLTVAVYDGFLNHAYDHIEDVVSFRVVDDKGRLGMVDLEGTWEQVLENEGRAYGRAG